jgi:hypothetical protein
MSLGDYLRLQRARRGGITPWEIEAATQLQRGLYRQMEQRYRAVGDEADVRRLADFYGLPYEELAWRQEWSRKDLSRALQAASKFGETIRLELWTGESVAGRVAWWDLGAVGLITGDGLMVVQRHAVERWSPRLESALGEPADAPDSARS